jgi:hypothetical protein
MSNNLLTKLLGFFLVLYCTSIITGIVSHPNLYQGDFYGYYLCAKAYGLGLNPYDAQITKIAIFPYVYAPFSLYFFQIFTPLNYGLAFLLFLVFKLMLVTGLIYLWHNQFLDKKTDLLFYLFCLLAFNSTFYLDLKAGNVSMIEQFMIWLAFFCYLRRKLFYFCALIMAAAIFKIQPILFLLLLLFSEEKNKHRYLAGSLAAFGMILLLQFVLSPELFSCFITNAVHTTQEGGIINPSTFTLIRELCQQLLRISDVSLLNKIALSTHFVVACTVLYVSWPAFKRIKSLKGEDKNKWVIFLACLCYALINIRFKDYSYILLIVPTYFIIKTVRISSAGLLLLVASISAANVTLPGAPTVTQFFWNYYPLFVAYLVWVLYLYELRYKIEK